MEELTNFGLKNSLYLPSSASKCFNILRDENDEPNHTYIDRFMRNFFRNSIESGRCAALNQYEKSTISDEVYNNISKELGVNGIICEILDNNFEILNKYEKLYEKNSIRTMMKIEILKGRN